jgi:lambda family phage tail tape measure protein
MNMLLAQSENDKAKAGETFAAKMRKVAEEDAKAQQDMSTYDKEYFAERYATAGKYYDYELMRIDQNNTAKQVALDLQYSLTDRMKAYDATFQQTFANMADAIVQMVTTGKASFKDLINSMIGDLIRYELKQQMMASYADIGGIKGLFKMFGGASSGAVSPMAGGGSYKLDFGGVKLGGIGDAQGAVYNTGLRAFAKGGTFTNSVVSSPTLFKFAQGTGLMGEAGPEAIMPLKRDNNGNLGVRTDSGNNTKVDVVVNNYSSEKATTTETVDSKGNRKIEVIVGDMVADQLSRTGSAAQQALTGSYGQRPSMVRR